MTTFNKCSIIYQVIKTHGKIHVPLIKGITSALFSIFSEEKYADKVVPLLLKANPQWGSRDRRFVAENTYELVRYWRYYWHILGEEPSTDENALLRLVGIRLLSLGFTLPEAEAFIDLRYTEPVLDSIPHATLSSYPEWLYTRCSTEIGLDWPKEADALNQPASVYLRVNTSKIKPEKALKELLAASIQAESIKTAPSCIKLEGRANLEQLELLKKGLVEIQDAGSQLIAPFLGATPGSFIIDACAGAGGKTLHLADITNDAAKITALDTEGWKLTNLRFRANKSGFTSIQTHTLPNSEFVQKNVQKADYLLLDVPCSGTGVIKRNPDTKWKLSESRIEELIGIQQTILSEYAAFLKPGGKCVYSTCSILPSENGHQVKKFLSLYPEFLLEKEHMQWPSAGSDGFYMALMQKKA